MEVNGTYRRFSVKIVSRIDAPFSIDESQSLISIRRHLLRPWRMLAALIDAMNAISSLDEQWALRMNKKGMMSCDPVTICGEEWSVVGCAVVGTVGDDGRVRHVPCEVDFERNAIQVSGRYNLIAGAASVVKAVERITARRLSEAMEVFTGSAA